MSEPTPEQIAEWAGLTPAQRLAKLRLAMQRIGRPVVDDGQHGETDAEWEARRAAALAALSEEGDDDAV